jgi:transcriptional regulator with XRE-family HTH domain
MRSVTPEELDTLIAGNVRARRAQLRLRQEDLADEIGWTRQSVTYLETGKRRLSIPDAIMLCRGLQIDLRQLLAGADHDDLKILGLDRRG